jgi:hypothetical protein
MTYRNPNCDGIRPDNCRQNPLQPDFEGTSNSTVEEFWTSAWKPKQESGTDAQSLSSRVRPERRSLPEQPGDYSVAPAVPPEHHVS